jgi:MFS family permease
MGADLQGVGLPDVSAVSMAPDRPSPAPERPSPPQRFLTRNWLLLFQGQTVSRLGNHFFDAAMALWIYDAFGSASIMAWAAIATNLPAIVLDPIGGVVADRFSRKKIIVYADLASGLLVLGLAALVFFVPGARELKLVAFITVSFSLTLINSFFSPALGAFLPDLVPRGMLPQANVYGQLSQQGTGLIGGPLGQATYALFGAPLGFLLNGISFLFASASESFIRVPEPPHDRGPGAGSRWATFRRDLGEGLRYVWHDRGLRTFLGLTTAIQLVGAPLVLLMVFYVERVLGLPKQWLSLPTAAMGLGALLGSLLILRLRPDGSWRRPLFLSCFALGGSGWVILGLVHSPTVTVAAAALGGMATSVGGILTASLLQERTPSAVRGRVMGLLGTVAGIMTAMGMGIGGIITDLSGQNIPAIYLAAGLVMLGLASLLAGSGAVRRFLTFDPTSV